MLRIEKIYQALYQYCSRNITVYSDDMGLTAGQLSETLHMKRNTVSAELNRLCEQRRVIKFQGRPVRFIDSETYSRVVSSEGSSDKNVPAGPSADEQDFFHTSMENSSIAAQLEQAKAAVVCPPNGLHMLIVGPTGAGKSYFAKQMYQYAVFKKVIPGNAPFISFNCADYADNPQLLNSQLFGYVKGSFTGAVSDRNGLVFRARGGYLFLDEVHNLPPEGQEMLFSMIDRHIYRKLGSDTDISCEDVRIICATTDTQKNALLSTFLRRIPITIELPPLQSRSIQDRLRLIALFFRAEAKRTGKSVHVTGDVVNRLLFTEYSGNIGELESRIQLLCSRAFLKAMEHQENILMVDRQLDVSGDSSRYHDELAAFYTSLGINGVGKPLDISAGPDCGDTLKETEEDFYDAIASCYAKLLENGVTEEKARSLTAEKINERFRELLSHSGIHGREKVELSKFIPDAILSRTRQLLSEADREIGFPATEDTLCALSFHTKLFVERSFRKQKIQNPSLENIRGSCPEAYALAERYVGAVCKSYGIHYQEDEAAFIAMFLDLFAGYPDKQADYQIIIACHGEHTAQCIAASVNRSLKNSSVKYVDVPLECGEDPILQRLLWLYGKFSPKTGYIFMTDAPVSKEILENFLSKTDRRYDLLYVAGFNYAILEAAARVLDRHLPMDEIQALIKQNISIEVNYLPRKKRKILPEIWVTCMTGIGAAGKISQLLQCLFKDFYIEHPDFITIDIKSVRQRLAETNDAPIALVGSVPMPEFSRIPHITLEELFCAEGLRKLCNVLRLDLTEPQWQALSMNYAQLISLDRLTDTMEAISPQKALDVICQVLVSLQELLRIRLRQPVMVQFMIHTAFMAERIMLNQEPFSYENSDLHMQKHAGLSDAVKTAIRPLENYFHISVPSTEIAYLVDILLEN